MKHRRQIDRPTTMRPLVQLARKRDWYRIENAAAEQADVWIYDEIGYWGVTADDFMRDLRGITAKQITLHLNTPGGDVFDGVAIHTALRDHPAQVTVKVDALAASIGSVIAMAGDRVIMARHSMMMIHEPWTITLGSADELRKTAELLDLMAEDIASAYAERAGGTVSSWRDRMREETWYTDRAAVEAGLADEVSGDEATAENRFDLSLFRHPPEDLLARLPEDGGGGQPTKRDIEKALRDAGLSHTQAKALIAAGWDGLTPEGAAGGCADPESQAAGRRFHLEQLHQALVAINSH